jgi:hypothetical protein
MRWRCIDCGGARSDSAVRCWGCEVARRHREFPPPRCVECDRALPRTSRGRLCRACYLASCWDRDSIAAAIAAAATNGRAPSYRQFAHAARAAPLFGTWNAAVAAAGFEPRGAPKASRPAGAR